MIEEGNLSETGLNEFGQFGTGNSTLIQTNKQHSNNEKVVYSSPDTICCTWMTESCKLFGWEHNDSGQRALDMNKNGQSALGVNKQSDPLNSP